MSIPTIRKPLEPIDDNAECRREYELLLAKYELLKQDNRALFEQKLPDELVGRIAEYVRERDDYNRRFDGHLETIEMVRAKIRRINGEVESRQREHDEKVAKMEQELKEKWPKGEPDFDDFERYREWSHDQFELLRLQHEDPTIKAFLETGDEESKFKELQDEAEARFEDVARHLTPDGRWLTDEEVAQRENGKEV